MQNTSSESTYEKYIGRIYSWAYRNAVCAYTFTPRKNDKHRISPRTRVFPERAWTKRVLLARNRISARENWIRLVRNPEILCPSIANALGSFIVTLWFEQIFLLRTRLDVFRTRWVYNGKFPARYRQTENGDYVFTPVLRVIRKLVQKSMKNRFAKKKIYTSEKPMFFPFFFISTIERISALYFTTAKL